MPHCTPFALSLACPEPVEGSKGWQGFDKACPEPVEGLSPNGSGPTAQ